MKPTYLAETYSSGKDPNLILLHATLADPCGRTNADSNLVTSVGLISSNTHHRSLNRGYLPAGVKYRTGLRHARDFVERHNFTWCKNVV
jgi:hypothetical protein